MASGIDTTAPMPRLNGEQLARHVGRKVLLVVKQVAIEGGVMRAVAADGMQVTVHLAGGGAYDTEFLEFQGTVETPTSLRAAGHCNFSANFDLGNYNELCKMAALHPEVFV